VLDDSFGSGGQRKIDFAGGFDEARGLALQSTGAIIVGGRCSPYPADLAVKGFCATRVLDNGSIDLNFGVNGRATASYDAPALNGVYGMTVDDADRVVLVGHVNVSWAIVRFGAGGVIDGGFGSGGRSVVPFAALSLAIAVKARADGGLIVGGRAHSGGDQFALARLNAGGTLEGPVSFTDFSGATDVIMALDLDPSGRIYAAGFSAPSISGDNQFALARYDRQGALDTAFGSGGRVTTSVAAGSDVAYAVRVVGERLIVAGASGGDFGLARYVVDGDLLFANGFDGAR
jgi:uncharacterized delta-60 repeat protein